MKSYAADNAFRLTRFQYELGPPGLPPPCLTAILLSKGTYERCVLNPLICTPSPSSTAMEPTLEKPNAKFIKQRRVAEAAATVRANVAKRPTSERNQRQNVRWGTPAAVAAVQAAKPMPAERPLIAPVPAEQAKMPLPGTEPPLND